MRAEKRPPIPAKRKRPKGGWPVSVKSTRHGADGTIAANHRRWAEKRAAEARP